MKSNQEKPNSDKAAVDSFKKWLADKGYTNIERGEGADVSAQKDGKTYFFEIKKTSKDGNDKNKSYFGAATLTEWKTAIENKDNYYFVIAIETKKEHSGPFDFYMISPQKLLLYSVIPPFKVDFNIRFEADKDGKLTFSRPARKDTTIVPNKKMIDWLIKQWEKLGKKSKKKKHKKNGQNDFMKLA